MTLLAIIPAKKHSTRLPGKNLMQINGESLVGRALRTAVESKIFDTVALNTDDVGAMVQASALDSGLRTQHSGLIIRQWRDWQLSVDGVESAAIALDSLSRLKFRFDSFCLLNPTSPCRTVEMLQRAHNHFVSHDLDCVVSHSGDMEIHNGDYLFWKTIPFLKYISRSIVPHDDLVRINTEFFFTKGIDINTQEDFDLAVKTLSDRR